MPRSRKALPRYLAHFSGTGRAVWNCPTGRREKILPGDFNPPESHQASQSIGTAFGVRNHLAKPDIVEAASMIRLRTAKQWHIRIVPMVATVTSQ